MSHFGALNSLLGDDPFFSPDQLLWPLRQEALSSLQQNFFNRRVKLANSLLNELNDGSQLLSLSKFPIVSSSLARLRDDDDQKVETTSLDVQEHNKVAGEGSGELLVTLDARGYAPSDITVRLEGRSLAVVAMKQAGAEESQCCSSSTSSASFSASASSQMGFMQKIDLPAHLDLSGLSCSLMDNGQLRIHAPVAKQPITEEHQAPLRFRSSLEFPIGKDNKENGHTN